jgi:hypothetical protein
MFSKKCSFLPLSLLVCISIGNASSLVLYNGSGNESPLMEAANRTWPEPPEYLPWHGDDTKLIAHHELGHAMGLNDIYLDVNFPFNADGKTSDQSNIMFYQLQKGHILRQRSIDIYKDAKLSSVKGKENQWDCLHRLPKGKPSCADASIVF